MSLNITTGINHNYLGVVQNSDKYFGAQGFVFLHISCLSESLKGDKTLYLCKINNNTIISVYLCKINNNTYYY